MKFYDKINLAWHNICINKTRSLLTTFIIYIIGFLIMGLLFIGISFSDNMKSVYVQIVKENNVTITHYTDEKINNIDDMYILFDKYDDLISNVYLYGNEIQIVDFKHFKEKGITIIKGNNPSNYENQNYIYLSNDLQSEYQIDDYYNTYDGKFIVAGFYISDIYYHPIVDLLYYNNNIDQIYNFSINYIYDDTRDFNKDVKNLNKLVEELNALFGSDENKNTGSSDLDTFFEMKLISTIIIVVLFFIAIILTLLSIGSISNSIMISVDQNQKYIGLLKILGLNNKGIKDIIIIETFLTIIFGIVFASFTLITLIPVIEDLILFLLEFMLSHDYYSVFNTFSFQVILPIYIPILSVIIFTILSVFFSKTSISKITKCNPIDIINEVN